MSRRQSPHAKASLASARRTLLACPLLLAIACERVDRGAAEPGAGPEALQAIARSASLEGNTIEIRLDRDEALVGDPIRLIVVATPAADRMAEIATPGATLGPFDVVELPAPRDAALPPGSKAIALELSTFESGAVEIPPILARFEPRGGGIEIELASDPIAIAVESALAGGEASPAEPGVDPGDLRANKGFAPMDDGRSEAWWWLASLGATIALVLGGFLLLRRRGPAPEPPPGPWATERLAALAETCRRGAPLAHAWDDSAAVLREYLARACGIPATDLTTREILDAIGRDPRFGDAARMTIGGFLRQADLVKFAGASADGETSARSIDSLRDLVAVLETDSQGAATGGSP